MGMVPAGVQADGKGNVIGQKWAWVTQDGFGTRTFGSPDMVLPVGQMPKAQVLDSKTFLPLTPNSVGAPGTTQGASAQVGDTPTSVPMTPDRQQAIKDATEHLNLLTQNEQKIQSLGSQVAAYIKANPNGAWTNTIMGTPLGLAIRRNLPGNDVTGQDLNQGISNNLNAIMDNMREGSKNGSLGMRLTGTEWNQMKQAFPNPEQAPQTMIKGWQNIASTNAYAKQYAAAYLKNLQTMQPGDAATQANAAVKKPNLTLPPPPANTIKVMAPDGRVGSIPMNNLGKALAAGYKQVQ
jgi:hypothetical protein